MMEELISVVVPAYNCAPWLPRCLDSLLNQTYRNLEIIVVNDGSNDNTKEVLEDYASRFPQIMAVHQQNMGECAARISGVDVASGGWIGFMDSDDEVEPNMYEMLYKNACSHGTDISHCGYKVIFSNGRVDYQHNSRQIKIQDTHTGLKDLLEEKIMEMSVCNKLYKKELFKGIREWMDFSIVINGDMLMNYYLFSRAEKSVLEDVCPYHYLIRQGSLSRRRMNHNLIYDPIRVRQYIVDHCTPDMKEDALRALTRMCLVCYRRLVIEPEREEYLEDMKNLRNLIREQLEYVPLLPRRNGLLVQMISYVPWVFDILYPLFERLFRK